MPSEGPLNAYVSAEAAGADGISPWTTHENALASGGGVATSWSADSFYLKSYYLILSDFQDATMGDSDTIDGVVVEVRAAAQDADRAALSYVALRQNGTVAGTPKTTATNLSTSQTYISRGGASDAFGAALTGADVKASTFQIALQFSNVVSSTEVQVDHVRVTFYYTEGGSTERRAHMSFLTLVLPDTSGTAKSVADTDALSGTMTVSVNTGGTDRRARMSYLTLAMPEVVAKSVSDTDTLVGVQTITVTAPDLPLVRDIDPLTGVMAVSVVKRLYSDYSNTDEAITPAVEGSTDISVLDVVPLVGVDTVTVEATLGVDDLDTLVGVMTTSVVVNTLLIRPHLWRPSRLKGHVG